jgi:hypothetical protein
MRFKYDDPNRPNRPPSIDVIEVVDERARDPIPFLEMMLRKNAW